MMMPWAIAAVEEDREEIKVARLHLVSIFDSDVISGRLRSLCLKRIPMRTILERTRLPIGSFETSQSTKFNVFTICIKSDVLSL